MSSRKGILFVAALVIALTLGAASLAWLGPDPLASFKGAKIDWQQAKGAKIAVAMNLGAEAEALQSMLADFTQLTGIMVDYQMYPELELHQKTLVDFAAHAGTFDVVMQDFMFTPQYADANFTEPLEKYLNDATVTDKAWYKPDDFLKGLWSAVQYKKATYAIPFTGETTLLIYRKDLFEKYKIKVPTTFDELTAAAKKLNNPPTMYGIGLRGQRGQGMNIFTWTQFFRGFGGKFFKNFPSDMTPTVNSPAAVKATQFYADILKKYGPPGVANWTNMEVFTAQQQGKIAMTMDANAFGPIVDAPEKSSTAGKWGYAVIPAAKGFKPAPAIYTHCLSLSSFSKNKKAAWLFIAWATSPEVARARALRTGVPARASSWSDPEFEKQLYHVGKGEYTKMTAKSLDLADGQYRPVFAGWREMGDRLGIAVQSVIAGETTAQKAMDAAQLDIATMLKK